MRAVAAVLLFAALFTTVCLAIHFLIAARGTGIPPFGLSIAPPILWFLFYLAHHEAKDE